MSEKSVDTKEDELEIKPTEEKPMKDDTKKLKTPETESQNSTIGLFNSKVSFISFVLVAVLSYLIGSTVHLKLYNLYIRSKYLPDDVLNYYVENPIDDIILKVPVYLESNDFIFPDLIEALNLQIEERLKKDEQLVINYQIEIREGSYENLKDLDDSFTKNALFLKLILNADNGIYVDGSQGFAELYYTLESVNTNDLPFFITQLILDHCYDKELSNYSIDSFIRLVESGTGKFSLIHAGNLDGEYVSRTKPQKIHLLFAMLGGYIYWDINNAFNNYMKPVLDSLSYAYIFTTEESYVYYIEQNNLTYIDEYFPIELSDLPNLVNFYHNSGYLVKDNIDANSTVYLAHYPFKIGGEGIKTKTVDGKEIYSEKENTFLQIRNWGSVYFSHEKLGEDGTNSVIHEQNLKDCMWSFNECILDHLKIPNENMAPHLRLGMFKRIETVKNLTLLSYRLLKIEKWLKHNDEYVSKELVRSILDCFKLRAEVIEKLLIFEWDDCLKLSSTMLDIIEDQIVKLNIKLNDKL